MLYNVSACLNLVAREECSDMLITDITFVSKYQEQELKIEVHEKDVDCPDQMIRFDTKKIEDIHLVQCHKMKCSSI